MVINQTRIASDRYFTVAQKDSPILIKVENVERFPVQLKRFGIESDDETGTTILPSIFNRYSKQNAEPYYTIDRTMPKEKYYQTIYWTRHEWAGGGETREVTEFIDVERERYHRDWYEPFEVSFTYVIDSEQSYLVSEPILYTEENIPKLINTVNMLLGLFGECSIIPEQEVPSNPKIKRLNWEILPRGRYPWSEIQKNVERISQNHSNTQKVMMLRNCESINALNPDFVAYGRAGFKGYAVFGFVDKNIYVLESVFPNNATYVFESNWEDISKLTKAEVLMGGLHKARIIHSASWQNEFLKLMGGAIS